MTAPTLSSNGATTAHRRPSLMPSRNSNPRPGNYSARNTVGCRRQRAGPTQVRYEPISRRCLGLPPQQRPGCTRFLPPGATAEEHSPAKPVWRGCVGTYPQRQTLLHGAYEGVQANAETPASALVLTSAQLSGNFSGGKTIVDPLTGVPFPGNTIQQAV